MAHHVAGTIAAEQFDAQLVEQQQVLRLARIAYGRDGQKPRIAGADVRVFDQRLGYVDLFFGDRGRLFALVERELGRSDADMVALVEGGFIDFLVVDVRAVATFAVANMPGSVL